MDDGAPPKVRFGFPQNLVGDWGGVSFYEQYGRIMYAMGFPWVQAK